MMRGNEGSVARVPESLRELRPKAYSPWLLGLGPIHHLRSRMHKAEAFKLAVAKQGLRRFKIPTLDSLVGRIHPLIPRIRSLYPDADVRLSDQTLARLIAIDGLFLLELLSDSDSASKSSSAPYFHPYSDPDSRPELVLYEIFTRIKLALTGGVVAKPLPRSPPWHSVVLHDVVLVENQIPLSLVAEAVAKFNPEDDDGDYEGRLTRNLDSLCALVSPLPLQDGHLLHAHHLLHYLYSKIIGESGRGTGTSTSTESGGIPRSSDIPAEILRSFPGLSITTTAEDDAAPNFATLISHLASGRKAVRGRSKQLPPETPICGGYGSEPTAMLLQESAGLKFRGKTDGMGIDFDTENETITIPKFRWHPHAEVVLRNLVMYEALANNNNNNNHLLITQYIHFMHMVIASDGDVKLLVSKGIITGPPSAEETQHMVELFHSLCTCRRSCRHILTAPGGKLLDDGFWLRMNQCNPVYDEVRSYYAGQPLVVAGSYFIMGFRYLNRCFAYVAAAAGGLGVLCALLKMFAPGGGTGDPTTTTANCGIANVAMSLY